MVYDCITVETPPPDPEVEDDSSFSEHTNEDVFIDDEFGEDDSAGDEIMEDG